MTAARGGFGPTFRVLLVAALWFALTAAPAAAQIVAKGRALVVTTSNAVLTFAGPDLVGFANRLTGERYLESPSVATLSSVRMLAGSRRPLAASAWAVSRDSASGRVAATLTASEGARALTLTVRVDPVTQDVVVRVGATSAAGLRSASWAMAGLDLRKGTLIVPAYSGIALRAGEPGIGTRMEYPDTWHAQMVVYQSRKGSVVVYSTDQTFAFKELRTVARGREAVDLELGTQAVAPFLNATSVPEIEWRVRAVSGDWRRAAAVYKDWLAVNRPPAPTQPWTTDVRTVVRVPVDEAVLRRLAESFEPSKTLLLLVFDWRRDDYDVNYPDYRPAPRVASFIAAAHGLGFRVMLHLNAVGVSPTHEAYGALQVFQARAPDTLSRQGWRWNEASPTRHAFVNPAASAFRAIWLKEVTALVGAVRPDALHLDVSAFMINDGNGPIEGLSYAAGSVRLHQELAAALPNVVLGGEGENDFLYRYHGFAQAWYPPPTEPVVGEGHPIAAFLFAPRVRFYGYIQRGDADDPVLDRDLLELERRGIQPMLPVRSPLDLESTHVEYVRLLELLRTWQRLRLEPAWDEPPGPATVVYRGTGTATAAFIEGPTGAALLASGRTLLSLIHRVTQHRTSLIIRGWPAFDEKHYYGLDPANRYFLDTGPRPTTMHIGPIPSEVMLGPDTMVGSNFLRVDLRPVARPAGDGRRAKRVKVPLTLAPGARVVAFDGEGRLEGSANSVTVKDVPVPGRFTVLTSQGVPVSRSSALADLPFETWRATGDGVSLPGSAWGAGSVASRAAGGVTKPRALLAHPPLGRTTLSWVVRLLEDAMCLNWSAGITDGAASGDGVTFQVNLDGAPVWTLNTRTNEWHGGSANLSAWRGRPVVVELVTRSGATTDFDWAAWGDVQIAPSCAGASPAAAPAPR